MKSFKGRCATCGGLLHMRFNRLVVAQEGETLETVHRDRRACLLVLYGRADEDAQSVVLDFLKGTLR